MDLRCVPVRDIPHQIADDQSRKRAQNSQDVGNTRLAGGHVRADGCNDHRPDQSVVCEDVLRGLKVGNDRTRHCRASRPKPETELGSFEEFLESPDPNTKSLEEILWWKVVDVMR